MSLTCTIESGAESEWQEAMTHETQSETDTGNGFVTYDELKGPYLDAAHWSPARLPLLHRRRAHSARSQCGAGRRRWRGPSEDPELLGVARQFQAADSARYLILSTRHFELSADRDATIAVDFAITNVGGEPETTVRQWSPSRCSTWR